MDLKSAVDLIYGAPPDSFTRLRDEQAAEARRAGDAALAEQIGRLRKPTVGAWLVNVLARRRTEDVEALLTLGERLRDAPNLDGDELRALLARRREREAVLLDAASELAAESEVKASQAALSEVRASLAAGLADAETAEAIRSGQLVRPIGYGDLTDATATPSTPAARPSRSRRATGRAAARGNAKPLASVSPAKLKAARDAVAKTERQLAAARAKLERSERRKEEAEAHAADVRKDVADLRRFLQNREADLKMAERNAQTAAKLHDEAVRKAAELDDELAAARAALADLA